MSGPSSRGDANPVNEVIDLVKTYAKQQTTEPLAGALRWLGWGVAGAMCLAMGLLLLTLGLLRLLQDQTTWFHGNWTFVPYVITIVACSLAAFVALSRIGKSSLARKESPR